MYLCVQYICICTAMFRVIVVYQVITSNVREMSFLGHILDICDTIQYTCKNNTGTVYDFTGTQCCGSGSGIRCLFDPWIRDPGWVKSKDPDPGSGTNNPDHIS
jgi:hypothetical protein